MNWKKLNHLPVIKLLAKTIEAIQQDLDSRDFYDPVNVDVHLWEKQIYHNKFVENVM